MHNNARTRAVRREGREGFALVTALLVVLVLSVLAVGVAWIATSEKKTTFAESVHVRSLYSADAGTEAGINLIRMADAPLQGVSFVDNTVHVQADTPLDGSQTYAYATFFDGAAGIPGWSNSTNAGYFDYNYHINADGTASRTGRASVDVQVTRVFKKGY